MALVVGIDIGGTFTDIIGIDTETGENYVTKVPSTPSDFSEGFFNGLEKVMKMAGAKASDVERLVHGTTVATNAILEHKGARIGLLTTKGFEDVLIMGRQWRSEMYSLFHDAETPTFLCSRDRILGITERITPTGILTPLHEDEVIKAVDHLVQEHDIQALAVSYLFSFVDARHEQRTLEIIRARYPKLRVSLSSTVNPRFREYERTVITAFDAYVGPAIEDYIAGLERGIKARGLNTVLQVMQSRGGITSGSVCIEKPVITLLSGLAGGVAGGVFTGNHAKRRNLITLDMGGTSNDVALIRDGQAFLSLESKIGKYPLRQAMVDVDTIGAGGGSIAKVDAGGRLLVGPQSAGAAPGPACYNRGGTLPTVTDASLVLGYLDPNAFGAGELALRLDLAEKAIQEHVAGPLGMSLCEAAEGIHTVLNNNLADQIRLVSVFKGYNPKDFSLTSFGGGGSVVTGRLMEILDMREVLIPPFPGVTSALGLLVADIEHEEVASFTISSAAVKAAEIERVFTELTTLCESKRQGVGMSEQALRITRSAEMRYIGQGYELIVPFPEEDGPVTDATIAAVVAQFHANHHAIYQHSAPQNPVEFVAFRTVFSQKPSLLPKIRATKTGAPARPSHHTKAYFKEFKAYVEVPVYQRWDLVLDQCVQGPAIIQQSDTTTVIYPHQSARVADWNNLLITLKTPSPLAEEAPLAAKITQPAELA